MLTFYGVFIVWTGPAWGIDSFVGTCNKLLLTCSVHLPTNALVVVIMTISGPFSLCYNRPGFICFWWQWVSEQSLDKKTGSVCRIWFQVWVWRHKSEVHHQWPRSFITRTVRECLFFSSTAVECHKNKLSAYIVFYFIVMRPPTIYSHHGALLWNHCYQLLLEKSISRWIKCLREGNLCPPTCGLYLWSPAEKRYWWASFVHVFSKGSFR